MQRDPCQQIRAGFRAQAQSAEKSRSKRKGNNGQHDGGHAQLLAAPRL